MITINKLSKVYAKTGKKAVDDISIEINQGEIFGFIGPNGAGKSTTIKCIMGILPFENGSIQICGNDISNDSIKAKQLLGFVPDNHMVYDRLTGKEYAYFMADIYGVSDIDRVERLDRFTTAFGLKEAINNPISSYSHGMKQKISIIGALIHNPKVWVLDEPLTGLDPKSAFVLKELMREHANNGNTVFFSSHVLDVVERVCDRVAIINNGQIVTVCTIDELKQKKSDISLEDFFLRITGVSEIPSDSTSDLAKVDVDITSEKDKTMLEMIKASDAKSKAPDNQSNSKSTKE